MAIRLSALGASRALLLRNISFSASGAHFCLKLSEPQGPNAAGIIRKIIKKYSMTLSGLETATIRLAA
jgi:hypothetical protein